MATPTAVASTLDRLRRRYIDAFEGLASTLDGLLALRGSDVGTAEWMDSQARRAAEACSQASHELLAPDGSGGVAAALVEVGFLAGTLLGDKASELAGFDVAPSAADASDRPARTRLVQGFVSATSQHLTATLTEHRETCERIRRASMLGPADKPHRKWKIVVFPLVWVRRVLYEAVHSAYLDRLIASGVDVMYITGTAPQCGTCARAVHQRLYSISGNDPTLPPLSSVTVYADPPLWHAGCKHPGVPYNADGPVESRGSADYEWEQLWRYEYDLGIGGLIFPDPHCDDGRPEEETDEAED